jgi:hypothetical protein
LVGDEIVDHIVPQASTARIVEPIDLLKGVLVHEVELTLAPVVRGSGSIDRAQRSIPIDGAEVDVDAEEL